MASPWTLREPSAGKSPIQAVPSSAALRWTLSNDLTLYSREANVSASGEFLFTNIPPNVYHLVVNAGGFQHYRRDLTVRSVAPVNLEIGLEIETQRATVAVSSEAPLIKTTPAAHADLDNTVFSKMPASSVASEAAYGAIRTAHSTNESVHRRLMK